VIAGKFEELMFYSELWNAVDGSQSDSTQVKILGLSEIQLHLATCMMRMMHVQRPDLS